MIYLLILLDVILNNYSKFTTYFFIVFLYNKPLKYYILTGLILDLIVFKSILINTIILIIIYLINRLFDNFTKDNFFNYVFINMMNYTFFIIFSNLVSLNGINTILFNLGISIFINILFYILSYRVYACKK